MLRLPDSFDEVQYRSATIDALEVEERLIVMRAVPYNVEAEVGDHIIESFAPRAFAQSVKDPGRVKLWSGHSTSGGRIVGQAERGEDRSDGLWLHTRVSRTPTGDELLTLAHDGVLDEASIEFKPIRESMVVTRRGDDLVVRHKRAHLRGVGLVPNGAYGRQALVMSVRDDRADARERVVAHLQSLTS